MCGGRASTDGRWAVSTRGVDVAKWAPLRGISGAEANEEVSMASSPRSGPQRRRTPVAYRQADDMLDIGAGGIRELAPAACACRGNALRNRAEAQAQQRRGAAVTARAGRAARRGEAEGAARRRHGRAFETPR